MVIGMFRAGTTFLSNLLDRDPANRALLGWESQDSAAPADPRDPAQRPARRRGPGRRRHARAAQPRDQRDPPRGGRRPDRVHRGDGAGVPEHQLGGDRQRADVRRVVAGRGQRPGLRLPPAGAAGAPERRRPRPLDAEEPAPRAGARRAGRGLPRRPAGAAPPRPGRAGRLGVQPDPHHVEHVLRRRPPRLHRRALDRHPRGDGPARSTTSGPAAPSTGSSTSPTPTWPATRSARCETIYDAHGLDPRRRGTGRRRRRTRGGSSARTATTSASSG